MDFVICKGNNTKQLVQVSYDISNKKTYNRETKGLLIASSKIRCDNLLLITDHDEGEIEIEGKKIRIVPAYSWLLEKEENLF